MSVYLNVNTLERSSQQKGPEWVALTDFVNGVDLEMWSLNVQHMEDCADGQYGDEISLVNYAKEWLQRAVEINRLLAARKVQTANLDLVVAADLDG